MGITLPQETKITDVLASLDDPIGYVRGVLENMTACRRKHGSAIVTNGLTGKGKAPHYRIAPTDMFEAFLYDKDLTPYFAAYHGRSHAKLDWGEEELRGHNWSGGLMTYDEVQSLLGELRGFKRQKS